MIIQIRGTSGSGKSTAMRQLMIVLGQRDPITLDVGLAWSVRPPLEWKSPAGYNRYKVSNHGGVYDDKLNKRKTRYTGDGYYWVTLESDRGTWDPLTVHELVLSTFYMSKPAGLQARHLNGNKEDNCITNLTWGTSLENSGFDKGLHGSKARGSRQGSAVFTDDLVREMRRRYNNGEATQGQMARELGVTQGAVSHAILGRNWRHVSELDGWEEAFVPGRKTPLYYMRGDIVVLGSYRATCGGCDSIGSARSVYNLATPFPQGRVVLAEGLLLSEDVKWTTQLKSEGWDVRVLFLTTPLDRCLDQIRKRRATDGNTKPLDEENTRKRVLTIERARKRLIAGGVCCYRCDPDQVTQIVTRWLDLVPTGR